MEPDEPPPGRGATKSKEGEAMQDTSPDEREDPFPCLPRNARHAMRATPTARGGAESDDQELGTPTTA